MNNQGTQTKHLVILGIRGVPAGHGGFETFAAQLAPFLVERGWTVSVYCQETGDGPIYETLWNGVRRIVVPVAGEGALTTMFFDWKCVSHLLAHQKPDIALTLGYNTAAFLLRVRFRGIYNVINMDGLEWQRDKWRAHERAWLWLNERIGCFVGDKLVADHPEIATHLARRASAEKIAMIPYGAVRVVAPDRTVLERYGLTENGFVVIVARPEPENSILEIVRGFSSARRGIKLVVLGTYRENVAYHREVKSSASDEVVFLGAIYSEEIVGALRYFSRAYVHGHTVGGTNPSLVEALGAGSPVIAHDNCFNRWVAGETALYFADERGCAAAFESICAASAEILGGMRRSSLRRHEERFTWVSVLRQYELLFDQSLRRLSSELPQ